MDLEDIEDRLDDIEKRLTKLEHIERNRKIFKFLGILVKLVVIIAVIYIGWRAYNYVNDTIIKPYKEAIDKVNQTTEQIDELKDKYNIFNR